MSDQKNQKLSLTDRLRQLLESLSKALKPLPQAPQPIPIDGKRSRH